MNATTIPEVEAQPSKLRVLLVEDHPIFREQLAQLIEKDGNMFVCGEADNTSDAFRFLESEGADIVVLDITLKGRNGLELLKDIKARGMSVPTLVLSTHDELLYAERVLRAGACGYITKHESSKEVMAAIRKVAAGELYVGTRMTSHLLKNFSSSPKKEPGVARLTDRELEVFELIGRGRTTRQICSSLHLGASTVETHRAKIKAKLNLENASQLAHEAVRWVNAGQSAQAGHEA